MIDDLRPPYRIAFDNARDPYAARNALGLGPLGTGPPAPVGAQYITAASDATLTNERVLTNTATVTWDFATAGQAKANVVAGSFGDVFLAANNAFTGNNSFAATTTLYSTTSFRSTVALPANGIDIIPAVTTGVPSINAVGIDTNISLAIKPKGTGAIDFYGQGVLQARVSSVAGASTYVRIRGAVGQGILDAVGGGYLNIIDANLSSGASGGAISVTPALSDSSTKVATTAFVRNGRTDASAVTTGYVGEYLEAGPFTAAAGSYAINTWVNPGSLSLPAGDWDVWGQISILFATASAGFYAGLSDTAATPDTTWLTSGYMSPVSGDCYAPVSAKRFNFTGASKTIYVATNVLSGAAYGFANTYIRARRRS